MYSELSLGKISIEIELDESGGGNVWEVLNLVQTLAQKLDQFDSASVNFITIEAEDTPPPVLNSTASVLGD